ncbi:MAG: hypothetical protein GX589_02505 [Deltaproteobacteria bacterium]|nr:hypothetical protein [Deltaproteobacteria bacterium]
MIPAADIIERQVDHPFRLYDPNIFGLFEVFEGGAYKHAELISLSPEKVIFM